MKHQVVISDDALFQMITAGLEAYCLRHPHKSMTAIECIGNLWGKYTRTPRTSKLLINSLTIDTSAKMNRGWVKDEEESGKLKKTVAQLFEHSLTWLGDFHTHPWVESELSNVQMLRKGRYYGFSATDIDNSYSSHPIEDTSLVLSLVMTFYRIKHTNIELDGHIDDNTWEFSIGNVKCWLHAQVYNVEEQVPEKTVLVSDFLESFGNIGSDFRHKAKA